MSRYRPQPTVRHVSRRILILCEGSVTEPNYFKAIKWDKAQKNRLLALQIVVYDSKKNTAKELVAEAIVLKREAVREKNPYDEIWVVVDKDGYTKHPESFDRARATGINIAFSSPCFEFWYFLHFQYSTAAIVDGDAMGTALNAHIPGYDKTENYYQVLKPLTPAAIERGERIIKHWDEVGAGHIRNFNPYTDVGRLVSKLLSL